MSFTEWLSENVFGADVAKGRELDAQLAKMNGQYAPGGSTYKAVQTERGTAAADANYQAVLQHQATGSTDALIAQYDAQDAASGNLGWGAVLKDFFILAVVGGLGWLFFKFGGWGWLKSKTGKVKWLPWAIVGGAVILAVWLYSRAKQTASDTGAALNNSFANPIKTLFGWN